MTHPHLRDHWRELKRSRPGHRFQDRYVRAHQPKHRSGPAQRIAFVAASVVCFALGVFFAVVPGPALPFFFVGGGLLASESRVVARAMDWSELRVRRVVKWGRRHFRRLPIVARVAFVLVAMACSLGGAYFTYQWFRD